MRRLAGLVQIVKALGWLFAWTLLWGPVIILPPAVGVIWLLTWCGIFFWWNIWKKRRDRRYLAHLRVRPIRPYAWWLLAAVPLELMLSLSLISVYVHLVLLGLAPPLPDQSPLFTDEYLKHPLGQIVEWLLYVCVAPLAEEFAFRGRMQRPLERAWGPVAAIGMTALVFAAVHGVLAIVPGHTAFGLIAGYAVYATRSIWAGVLMHGVSNLILVGMLSHTSVDKYVLSPPPIQILIALTVVSVMCLIAVGLRVRAISHAERTAHLVRAYRPEDHRRSLARTILDSSAL